MILKLTRNELIRDLPKSFREQNDTDGMSNKKLITSWKRFGTHAGTWDWDEVRVVT